MGRYDALLVALDEQRLRGKRMGGQMETDAQKHQFVGSRVVYPVTSQIQALAKLTVTGILGSFDWPPKERGRTLQALMLRLL